MAFESFSDFRLLREVSLPSIRATAREFEHISSGARLLHLYAPGDVENCFAMAFPTPPASDNGVPHILEHAVLAGSDKYPLREPFFEMIKSSPAGFINAMTSDLWTIYPICTTLEKDFFNLADVYVDAVFHPQLTLDTFEREGHHLQMETAGDLNSDLVRSGIVYNEMKGAYSNTEMVIHWRLKNKLYPGGPLGHDSGGDPAAIPTLTWEGLRSFHDDFYAAGNCTVLLYGDIETETHLGYWGGKLKGLAHKPSLAGRPVFDKWTEPRTLETTFAAEPGQELSGQTYLSLRWHCGDGLDPHQEVAWTVLSQLLAGHDGAPLKKALVASKLGADVLEAGVEESESELAFHVALKGSERERADEFVSLVERTLADIAETGFSTEDVETAFRQVAYSTLEVLSLFPLHLAFALGRYAACGADPLLAAQPREVLEAVREQAEGDPGVFSRMIREGLLENPHRLLTVFYPDPEHAARQNAREKEELAKIKASFTPEELKAIDERAQALEAAQDVPNSPEAIALLPRLGLHDLPEVPREIPTSVGQAAGFTLLRNDLFSNGVVYLHAAVDISDLPAALWKFVPRYTDAFGKLGAAGQSWEQIAGRRAAVTGSLGGGAHPMLGVDGKPFVDLRFGLKTLDGDVDAALDLFEDLVFQLEPGDRPRLHEMQTQGVSYYRDFLVNNAVGAAIGAAALPHAPLGWLGWLWRSPLTYSWMRGLTDGFASRADELIGGIEAVRDFLLDRGRWTFSFTGSDAAFERVQDRLGSWHDRLREGGPGGFEPRPGDSAWDGGLVLPPRLGLAAPLDVQFCAQSYPAPSREVVPLVELAMALARFDYFLPEIRFKGNAYGAGAAMDENAGHLTFFSYRDPRLSETLRVFDGAAAWIAAQDWTSDDLERAVLGNVKDAVPALRPAECTGGALTRHRRGESSADRAHEYRTKLSATPAAVKAAFAEYFEAAGPKATVAVAGSRAALEKANGEGLGLVVQEMLGEKE